MSMREPEVSVVIPSYNHERYITAAVQSVLSQSFANLELIVIDDGSADGSVQLLERMAAGDQRMTVVRQQNGGSHAAINNGLAMAKAPWVAILNSDDVWHPDRLRVMLEEARLAGGDFLFSDVQLIDADGAAITDPDHWWNVSIDRFRQRVLRDGVGDGLLYGNLTVSTSNFLFKREILSRIGYFRPYRYNLDWEFVLRCLFADGLSVRFVPQPLLEYRLHGDNAILSGMPRAAIEAQVITRRLYRKRWGVPENLALSDQRHDRLLRRFLSLRARQFEASFHDVQQDRDRLAQLMLERQGHVEAERAFAEAKEGALKADLAALEENRDHLAQSLHERQAIIEGERVQYATALSRSREALDRSYRRGVWVSLDKEIALCRQARLENFLADCSDHPSHWTRVLWRGLTHRLRAASRLESAREKSLALTNALQSVGVVRQQAPIPEPRSRPVRVAAHVHLYYKDLASELFELVAQTKDLHKVVVTGPWDEQSLEPALDILHKTGAEIVVVQVPNRGKDVGGLIHAITEHALLDSDYVLKIHSKKSHNPATYFEAISALFGIRIENGDQWRRALVEPLAGTAERIDYILGVLESDRTIGMVGAAPFVTTAPDANAELYSRLCVGFGVPTGMPFVAGTMFWVRSALLAPLLEGVVDLNDFDLNSRAVEGGMEHIMERLFGAFSLSRGFDLLGVR